MPRRTLKNKTIEVILLQQNKYLWEKYEIVRVKPIFARNVLLPNSIAVLADKANINKYQQKMESAEKERTKKASSLNDLIQKIQQDDGLSISRSANKEWVLYAQVAENDIAQLIQEKYGMAVDSHYFKIRKKIKMVWDYLIPFVFKDVKKDIALKVQKEEDKK